MLLLEDDKYVFEQELEAIESDPDGKLQEMRARQTVAPMPVEDDGGSDAGARTIKALRGLWIN